MEHLKAPIRLYFEHGIDPGLFLRAVLSNDLRGVISHPEYIKDKSQIRKIISYCDKYLPDEAWGSAEAVNNWLANFKEKSAHNS